MRTRFMLPTEQLTEPTSLGLANALESVLLPTPLSLEPIATTFVHHQSAGALDGANALSASPSPILLLHGFDSSVFEFRRLLPLLSHQRDTWAVDLLGFGFTQRLSDCPFSPAAIKAHLFSFWKTLMGQPVIVVGASMGGAAAIDFALSHPEAVQQLVLIDSAGLTAGPPIGKFLVPPLGKLATGFLRNPKVRQDISVKAYYDANFASTDALSCAALHLDQPNWQEALITFTRSGGYGSFRRQLAHLQQPTLILWGENDRILGTADAARFQQAIPNSQLIWIPQCGHVPHLEKPQETAHHILAWCN